MAPTEQKSLVLPSLGESFVLETRPVPKPGKGQVLAKVEATALNPVDWKIRDLKLPYVVSWPTPMGTDAAGVVEEVGEGVTNLKPGDKILWQGMFALDRATFQQYSLLNADLAAKIPENISVDEAASIPLALATAWLGLFNEKRNALGSGAALEHFWTPDATGKNKNKPIVVVGGTTSVGQYVIQLAKLAGFSPIITTASEHNTDLLKSYGATHVLSRSLSASELKSAISKITSDPITIVYDAVSLPQTLITSWDILGAGGQLVVVLKKLPSEIQPGDNGRGLSLVFGNVNIHGQTELGLELYKRLSGWVRDGSIKPNRVQVLPNGLAGIEAGLTLLKEDKVSGTKLIAHPHD